MPENNPIILIILIYAIGVLVYQLNESRIKGSKGEYDVAKLLRKLNHNEYKILNDIYLELNERTTQIDHLIVSIYGIFVIETKNYKGWIHGNENSEYWTQSIYHKKTKFRNPIKQNWSHIYFLKDILQNYKSINYHSIIVFVGDATLKNVYSNVPVIYKHELVETINENGNFNLSYDEVEDISDQICRHEVSDRGGKRKHRRYVKQSIRNRAKNISEQVCPNCNGKLIVRSGRFGEFYGCSNFPNCKFSKNI